MGKLLGVIIVLAVVVIGLYVFGVFGSGITGNVVKQDDVKVFVMTGENFKFLMDGVEAPEIRVNEGDRVRIEFTSISGFHDWVVDEFGAATDKVRDGSSTSIEFIADEKGTFEYYCSVGEHRANGMIGNLVVE